MKNRRAQAIIGCMNWRLGLVGLAALVAIALAVTLLRPTEPPSAVAPEPAASTAAGPAKPAPPLEPVAPLTGSSTEAQAERRVASPLAEGPSRLALTGNVLDRAGEGLPDISIKSCTANGSRGAPDSARFETDSDEAGQFELAFTEGARPTHARFESNRYLPRVIALPDTSPWEVVLEARPLIEGSLLDRSGAPLNPPGRVSVRVRAAHSGTSTEHRADLEADGTYRFDSLPAGRLTNLAARAKGFDKHEVELDLALPPGARQTHDVTLERGLVVRGVVLLEETREPVPYARVWGEGFDYEEDSVRPSTIADSEGRFRLEGFERNTVDYDGTVLNTFQIVAASETHASSPLAFVALVPEEDGEYELEIVIEQRACAVRGVVLKADGTTACQGALIWGIDAQSRHTFKATNGRGEFSFEDLPTGPFGLVVYRTARGDSGLYESLLVELELESEGATGLRLVLESSAGTTLEGQVLDAQGAPVSGFEIAAKYQFNFGGLTMGLDSEVVVTDANGRYRFADTRAGLYTLEPSGCTHPRTYELTLAPLENRAVNFTAGTCMTIEGWIELDAAPASDFRVRLFDLQDQMITDAVLLSDGTFRIPDLIAKDYEVILFRHGERLDRAPVSAAEPTGIVLRVP